MKLKILSEENQNPFYDTRKCRNGGGYYQPLIRFKYDSKPGQLLDDSCGEFGKRLSVDYDGKTYMMDEISRDYMPRSSFTENDRDFITALEKESGYRVLTREELSEQ